MKDIPCFATENGIAGLVLQQIPYSGIAYITVHRVSSASLFIQECVDFCRAVGATRILASGHAELEGFPVYAKVLRMATDSPVSDAVDCRLEPATAQSIDLWLELYNKKMQAVPLAEILSKSRANELLSEGRCYFVYRDALLLGCGIAGNGRLDALAASVRGEGENVLRTLCRAAGGGAVEVEVSHCNMPALRLYDKLGFRFLEVRKIWYEIPIKFCGVK